MFRILQGVTAFLAIDTLPRDVQHTISAKARFHGAQISRVLDENVTHIFAGNDASQSSIVRRALDTLPGVFIISPMWVDDCVKKVPRLNYLP
jgi:hypothetical protein